MAAIRFVNLLVVIPIILFLATMQFICGVVYYWFVDYFRFKCIK